MEGARSFRVAWLCEELGLPYKLLSGSGDLAGSMAHLRKEYPLMPMCPVVRYKGQTMVESGAILEVLTMRHGPHLMPAIDSPDYLRHEQWMHYAEASLMQRMITQRLLSFATGVDVDKLDPGYSAGDETRHNAAMIGPRGMLHFVEDYLGQHAFFGGGAFSPADIMMHFGLRMSRRIVWIDSADYPNISRWRTIVEQRPAFARAVATTTPNGVDSDGFPHGSQHPFTAPPARAN